MHVTNNKLKISKRHRLNIVSGDSFHPGGKCRQENSSSGRCCGNQNSRMKHKHIITLMPFQTRLPQQVLTTTTRPYAPSGSGKTMSPSRKSQLLLRQDNPNRYGKLDRSEKTQSNFLTCRRWNSRRKRIPLASHACAVRKDTRR